MLFSTLNPKRRLSGLSLLLFAALILVIQETVLLGVTAHSWLDCSQTASASSCKGYAIGYPSRANPDINTLYTYLVSGRNNAASVCQPGRQNRFSTSSAKKDKSLPFPPVVAKAGQTLNLSWEANGHLDDPKHHIVSGAAKAPSQVEVYWTGKPETLLTTRGKVVDNKKMMLAQMNFATPANCDDPKNPNTVCHGKVQIPKGTKPGRYQLVWWWKFDKNPVGEEYSTCFQVNVQ
ncbi:hypothetical protein BGZ83_001581 [Gryganskiella cystojenkinii]|nr:hypothetical protein BGZ83_001581 [Gryganskiella cystojenkinii]